MSIHTLIIPVEPMAGHTAIVVRGGDSTTNGAGLALPAAGAPLDEYLTSLEAHGTHELLSVAAVDNLHVLVTVRGKVIGP